MKVASTRSRCICSLKYAVADVSYRFLPRYSCTWGLRKRYEPRQSSAADSEQTYVVASVDGLLMPRKQNSWAEHELVLLDSFWQGLQSAEGAASTPFLRTQQAFDETSWSRTCQGLYPSSLTAVLNGRPAGVPAAAARDVRLFGQCLGRLDCNSKT